MISIMFFLVTCRTPRLLNLGGGGAVGSFAGSSFLLRHPPRCQGSTQPYFLQEAFPVFTWSLGFWAQPLSPWSDAKLTEVGLDLGLAGNEGSTYWAVMSLGPTDTAQTPSSEHCLPTRLWA